MWEHICIRLLTVKRTIKSSRARAIQLPRPKVYPLVLIRLPSDVKRAEASIPTEVPVEHGEPELHHQLPEEIWGFVYLLNVFVKIEF